MRRTQVHLHQSKRPEYFRKNTSKMEDDRIGTSDSKTHQMADEIETVESQTNPQKPPAVIFSPVEERRLVRKLDLWYGRYIIS